MREPPELGTSEGSKGYLDSFRTPIYPGEIGAASVNKNAANLNEKSKETAMIEIQNRKLFKTNFNFLKDVEDIKRTKQQAVDLGLIEDDPNSIKAET